MAAAWSFKLVRKEIIRSRKIPRNELLDKEKSRGNDSIVVIVIFIVKNDHSQGLYFF